MKKLFVVANLLLALSFISQNASALLNPTSCNAGDSVATCSSKTYNLLNNRHFYWFDGYSAILSSNQVVIYQNGQYVDTYNASVENGYLTHVQNPGDNDYAYIKVQLLDGNMNNIGAAISFSYEAHFPRRIAPTYTVCLYENSSMGSCI
ncbi:hypothetical protein [Candidatus Albibeggiatoa sp. nov. BB20]|uniref:hypothetical protein n=1 Tax=Candidatus Albibeggiatoa sp. nov. BB20 TaxID=3162723 RepID=UPI00336569C7